MAWRVLVTGLGGFTGQHLAAQLRLCGHEVFGLTLNGSAVDLEHADAVAQAVRELKPTHVVHLAAISFVAHADIDEIYRVNVLGTRHLLQALAEHAPSLSHVLLASSATVYGAQAEGLINESAPVFPANDYAVSKLAMEHLAGLWRDRLPITIVRPFNYVGVGQAKRFVIPKIVAHFRARAPRLELGNVDVWREYNDVRWVIEAYLALLAGDPAPVPVNLASGRLHSLGEVLASLRAMTGHDPDVVVNPAFVRANEVVRLGGDPERLLGLGIRPSQFVLDDTLRWMLT